MNEQGSREAIVAAARRLSDLGLNPGTSGNVSVRSTGGLLVTPSGIEPVRLEDSQIAHVSGAPDAELFEGPSKPSSEWRMHRDIYVARPDIGAIVHTHSTFATVLAMLRMHIPAAHYEVAMFGGSDVRCTAYAPYGTQELSDLAVAGLADRFAVLLGSHGMIAAGRDLDEAMARAIKLEHLAKIYYLASAVGAPPILDDEAMAEMVERFKAYGRDAQEPRQ